MTADRDGRRFDDPLHDTMDETSDAVVVGEVDPDPTPLPDVVASIAAIVGELDSDARDRLAEAIGSHDKRGKLRAANKTLAAIAVDQRKVIAEVDRDLPEWVRGIEAKCESAETAARDAAAKAKVCDDERIKREKWKGLLFGGKVFSVGGIMTLLVWAITKLDARAAANAEENRRIVEHRQLLLDVRSLQDWRIKAETLLGIRRRAPTLDPDRGDP